MGCIKRKLNAVRFISRQVACGGVENGGSVFIAEYCTLLKQVFTVSLQGRDFCKVAFLFLKGVYLIWQKYLSQWGPKAISTR